MLLGRLANVSRSLRRRVLELTAGLAIVGLSPDGHAAGPEAPPSAPQAETSYEATLQALTFRGESAFLVLGEAMRSPTWAARRVGQRLADGIAATSIPSDYFTGLNKGRLVVVYGGFTEKDAARMARREKRAAMRGKASSAATSATTPTVMATPVTRAGSPRSRTKRPKSR